ncbi:MAG: ATP synthase subunit b [Candidatus Roizmanbacteria bacterium GW2011_GWA2_35_19]|uniref:ATP synthase subunit b n=2 Tax=Candidatus Roizmaniibacteriota TaxID=1752723 RepID=A0A0G0CBM2_9BACT|nr:MAG: ATP synthase subunit b [Candidatus Roizmanbacteria bacterium GW2011_GWC2_35_12]KKP73466.1 MAG: ATP synthase subunit b [Candidatus Roizmanbacteria bacterium GW2011_GWA2_35_19]
MENLGIDIKLLIAQMINFGLFFFIIKKFVTKPFLNFVEDEKNKEAEKARLIEKITKQEEEYAKKERDLQMRIKKEMEKALLAAKNDAKLVKEEMINEAKSEAAVIRENAKKEIIEDKEKLYSEIKSKIAELSLVVVKQSLSDVLDDSTKRKISEKLIDKLGKTVKLYEN